jgi:hypothetical protein
MKMSLPIWFSRLGIHVKKKEAVSLFVGTAVILVTENMQMSHCTQPTMYKSFHFKIEIKTMVDSYMPYKGMALSTKFLLWWNHTVASIYSTMTFFAQNAVISCSSNPE